MSSVTDRLTDRLSDCEALRPAWFGCWWNCTYMVVGCPDTGTDGVAPATDIAGAAVAVPDVCPVVTVNTEAGRRCCGC